ncbi:hypothetical protein ACH79_06410 [Bradyrhizobium sp. CCBAU 051011]|nr:hypothetical protein ACH79_06410 [Bradyrhizobium sp. CCBAU 051011]
MTTVDAVRNAPTASVWIHDDGGRAVAGFAGKTGDCVTRAIAIATGSPYREVYDELFQRNKEFATTSCGRKARLTTGRGASPRNGVWGTEVARPYLLSLGWTWRPTMHIGSGCKVHLRAGELPNGRLVVALSGHCVAVIDGVVHDIYDCTRGGTRCVYGYFRCNQQVFG